MKKEKQPLNHYHRFLDEAGDMTFYGKGRVPILGEQGVSQCFILGMVKFHTDILPIRKKLFEMQNSIPVNPYYENVPSVVKRVKKGGFYFHAKDDLPELRKEFFDFIKTLDCSFYAVVARKNYGIFERKHHGKSNEMYVDLLSHLLIEEFNTDEKLILNIAELDSSTHAQNLEKAVEMARGIGQTKKVTCNTWKFKDDPLLSIADYMCWTVQRIFETGETRFYNYMKNKIGKIWDIYDKEGQVYVQGNPLTEKNKVGSQLP